MRSPPISHTHLAGAMRHRPGRTWKETSSFAGCRLKKRKRTGEMVISGGDDEFYMCILLPSGSVGCFKSWVFFRLAGIFFVLWKQATFQFEHRFFIWRNIFKNDEATFQFYRQTQIQQYEINNSTLNQFCAFSFFLLAVAAVVVPGILMEWPYLKHWRKKTQQISLSFSPRRAAFPGSFPGALLSWTAGRWRTTATCGFASSSFGSWRVFVCSSPLRCHYYY